MRISDWSSDVCSSDLAGRAGLDAGRVVAEVAAAGLDQRGLAVERRVNVAEVLGVGGVRQTPGTDVRLVSHRDLPDRAGGRCSFAAACVPVANDCSLRSEEHTSELQSLMRISYAVFCLKKKKKTRTKTKQGKWNRYLH